jgi:hypothetical protein
MMFKLKYKTTAMHKLNIGNYFVYSKHTNILAIILFICILIHLMYRETVLALTYLAYHKKMFVVLNFAFFAMIASFAVCELTYDIATMKSCYKTNNLYL